MKHLIYTVALSGLSIFLTPARAQEMTLDDCMAYAVEHSPHVAIREYANDNLRQDRNQALASFFPAVSGSVGGNASFGRVAGADNIAVENTTQYSNSYSIGSGLPLFAGLSALNTYKAARTAMRAGREELDLVRDQVALEVMQAWFDAVYYAKAAALAADKLAATQAGLLSAAKQEELGMKSRADVLELEAQAASDEFLLTQQQNLRDMALVLLKEKMNYPADEELRIDENIGTLPAAVGFGPEETMAGALNNHPEMKIAGLSLLRSEFAYKAARGRMLPSLSLSAGYGNGYYNIAGANNHTFGKQWELNRTMYVGMSLRVPIFGGLSNRASVNRARNAMRIAELEKESARRSLQSEVEQNYRQLQGLEKEHALASRKVDAAEMAHKAASRRYELGTVSPFELQTSANRLLEAQAQQLGAQLQYMIKLRLVEYYNGRPLVER
jgi:outer membrane protein